MSSDANTIVRQLHQAGFRDLPTDWKLIRVEDLLAEERGIAVGVMYPGPHCPGGVPLIKAGDISNHTLKGRPDFCVSEEKHIEYRRTALEGGELLMTLVGNIGQCAVVPSSMKGWNTARAVAVLRTKKASDVYFLRLCLSSPQLYHLMDAWSNTTVQQTLNLKEIRKLPLPWPRESVRQNISIFISTLDDKIELNRRMNETLDSIARAVFKSWFVDFDPVRAKLEGQSHEQQSSTSAYPMPAEVYDLFPSAFQDSELGKIPQGWEVGVLEDLLVLQRGFDLPKTKRLEGVYPVCAAGGHHGFHSEFKVKGPGVVTGRSGVIGKVYYIHGDHWPLNTTLWVKEFGRSRPIHAYHFLKDFGLERYNAGSAVPTLNRNHVHSVPVDLPPQSIVNAFEAIAQPLFDLHDLNVHENETISNLRDTLLPKLLSGELTVPDALLQAEEVL